MKKVISLGLVVLVVLLSVHCNRAQWNSFGVEEDFKDEGGFDDFDEDLGLARRHLWSLSTSRDSCSFRCDLFSEKCPYPTKCTNKHWLQRAKVICFKRDMQLYQSRGQVWCGPETNPSWSNGIGRSPHDYRRLSRIEDPTNERFGLSEYNYPRRMLRRSTNFEEAMEVFSRCVRRYKNEGGSCRLT